MGHEGGLMKETWMPVPEFEGRYEVSDLGRLRSVSRLVRTMKRNGEFGLRRIKSKILAVHTYGAQYPGIVMYSDDGASVRRMVHRIVAEVFVPNPERFEIVNHIDGNGMNPQADNLEWCNQSMNMTHAYKIGRRQVGKDHHFARLKRDAGGRCLKRANSTNRGDSSSNEYR